MSLSTADTRLAGMLLLRACFMDSLFIRRKVDAIDLVLGDVAVQPLNLWANVFQSLQGAQRDFASG